MPVPPSPLPPSLSGRPFLVREALALGLTPRRLRARDLRAPHRQVRVPASLPWTLELRARAALLVLPRGAVFAGATAVALLDLPAPLGADEPLEEPLRVAVPPRVVRPRVEGVTVRPQALDPAAVVVRRGAVPVLHPAWAWADRCADLDLVEAVALGDAVRRRSDDVGEALRAALALEGPAARDAALAALFLVRHPVDSPMETRLRLLLRAAGIPEPICGRPVLDGGHEVARPDLSWPAVRVAVEYDGAHHLTPRQRQLDLGRQRVLEDLGWRVVVVTAEDLLRRPDPTTALVERVLRQQGLRW